MKVGHELDFASGYFTVFPCDFRNPDAPQDKPFLYISEDCPENLKEKILKTWEKVKTDTEERHKKGFFSSNDYF